MRLEIDIADALQSFGIATAGLGEIEPDRPVAADSAVSDAGPVGVKARNFRADRIESLGWKSRISLREGLSRTYPWVKRQVEASR